jgi:hypothetical protein
MKTVEIFKSLWFDNDRIFMETVDGERKSQHLRFYPRLKNASAQQRNKWTTSPFGLHWEAIDEDISFDSFYFDENDNTVVYRLDECVN